MVLKIGIHCRQSRRSTTRQKYNHRKQGKIGGQIHAGLVNHAFVQRKREQMARHSVEIKSGAGVATAWLRRQKLVYIYFPSLHGVGCV